MWISPPASASTAWARAIRPGLPPLRPRFISFGHTSNLFYTEPCVRLAQTLTARTGMANAFFANGGGEANEGMIKLARKYSFDKYGAGRS